MAKNTQEADVIITVNGKAAEEALTNLTKKQKDYERAVLDGKNAEVELEKLRNTSIADLKLEGKTYSEVEAAIKSRIKAGQEADKKLNQIKKDIQINRTETKKFADVLNNINGSTLKELDAAARQLKNDIRKLTPGTQEYIEKSRQLKEVNSRIVQLRNGFKGVVEEQKRASLSLRSLADGFNRYWGFVTMGIGAITGMSMGFRKCAEEAAKLDDVYADVMKTTGLLHDQVEELDKELMKIDTRTSREQLLLLARDAGKLGIQGKENILGFVRAADQIQVALGEDLGEGAIKQLGKIADVYGLTQTMGIEKALLSIGSAVNALGQASTASEAYLVEFTQRLAGVGAMAGVSVQNIMGFASGLDQSSMKVEMAATAFQKFLMKMYEDTATFAGYAGMEVEKFADLLKRDANQAIVTVLKTLNGKDGFAELVPMFNEMGLDGARAVQVLAAMAKNLNAVTIAQSQANIEFEKATSVTNEYSVKNNNLQAQLEKNRKKFHDATIALGQSLNPVLLKSTKILNYLIKLLAEHGKEIFNAVAAIAALTAAIYAQTAAEKAAIAVKKLWATITATGTVLSNKLAAAYYYLTNQTLKYAAAQRTANAALSKSVYGLIAVAVGYLAFKITELNSVMEENEDVTGKALTTEEKIAETYTEEKGKIDALNEIINNQNASLSQRNAALLELKNIVPNYHADLTEEGALINNNTTALEAYLVKLKQKIKLEAYKEDFVAAQKAVNEYERSLEEAQRKKEEIIAANGGVAPTKKEAVVRRGPFLGLQKIGIISEGDVLHSKKTVPIPEDEEGNPVMGLRPRSFIGQDVTIQNTEYGNIEETIKSTSEALDSKKKVLEGLMEEFGLTITEENREMQNEIDLVQKEYELKLAKAKEIEDQGEMKEEVKRIQQEKEEAIAGIKEKYTTVISVEASENTILSQLQFDYLAERQNKLTKKEKEMVKAGYASLSEEESKALKTRYDKLVAVGGKTEDQRYNREIKAMENAQRNEENLLQRSYEDRDITTEVYEQKMVEMKVKHLEERKAVAEKYGKDTSEIDQQMLKAEAERHKYYFNQEMKESEQHKIAEEVGLRRQLLQKEITQDEFEKRMVTLREKYLKEQQALATGYNLDDSGLKTADLAARQKEEEDALKRSLNEQLITQEEYDAKMIELKMKYLQERLRLAQAGGKDETEILKAMLQAQVEAEELAAEQMKKLREEAEEVIEGLRSPSEARDADMKSQLARLEELHAAMLLSEEQYEEAVKQMRKKYATEDLQEKLAAVKKYSQQTNSIIQQASDFVTALKEAESQKLEAEYQAQLTAAGNNAEQREQIESEYEQKKLDLQKKYADVDMAINIAKAIAAGALAAVEAFAAAGGNPILGGVFAAIIAATTAAEVATIVAQRNAIKATSVNSNSSSSSVKTGERKVTGYSEGGYTEKASSDMKPAGIIHANEWVAPAWMVRSDPVTFANLERYRRDRSRGRLESPRRGFAEGGYTSAPAMPEAAAAVSTADIEAAVEAAIRRSMKEGAIRAYLVRKDLTELDAQTERFKKQTTR